MFSSRLRYFKMQNGDDTPAITETSKFHIVVKNCRKQSLFHCFLWYFIRKCRIYGALQTGDCLLCVNTHVFPITRIVKIIKYSRFFWIVENCTINFIRTWFRALIVCIRFVSSLIIKNTVGSSIRVWNVSHILEHCPHYCKMHLI